MARRAGRARGPGGSCPPAPRPAGPRSGRRPQCVRRVRASAGADSGGPSTSGRAGAGGPWEGLSAEEVALEARRKYISLQSPARANITYAVALQDFVDFGITTYTDGRSQAQLREELVRAEERLPLPASAGSADLLGQSSTLGDVELQLVWLTLERSPKRVRRWSLFPAVDAEFVAHWNGLVRGMGRAVLILLG